MNRMHSVLDTFSSGALQAEVEMRKISRTYLQTAIGLLAEP
jgi:hypothetical protein